MPVLCTRNGCTPVTQTLLHKPPQKQKLHTHGTTEWDAKISKVCALPQRRRVRLRASDKDLVKKKKGSMELLTHKGTSLINFSAEISVANWRLFVVRTQQNKKSCFFCRSICGLLQLATSLFGNPNINCNVVQPWRKNLNCLRAASRS